MCDIKRYIYLWTKSFTMILFQYFIVPCRTFGSPNLGKAQQLQEQCYPFLSVCVVFSCVQTMVWLLMFGIFNMRRCWCVRLHTGAVRAVRESELEVDWEKKKTCHTGDSSLHQHRAWFFSWTLYQLSHPHPSCLTNRDWLNSDQA